MYPVLSSENFHTIMDNYMSGKVVGQDIEALLA